jgi:hypothetical protein
MKDFAPQRQLTGYIETEQQLKIPVWIYADPKEQSLLSKAGMVGKFNLVDFDSWLIELGPCEARDELIERRQNAIEAKNIQELRHHLEFLNLQWHHIRREDALLPRARNDKASRDKRSEGGQISKAIKQAKADELSEKIFKLHSAMMIEYEKEDKTLLNIHVIRKYQGLYNIEISNYLIRKAIRKHRPQN